MMDINENLRKLLIIKGELLLQKSTVKDFEAFLNDESQCEYRKALVVTLNYFESISAMVNAGDLDNEIVKKLFGKLFGRYYEKLELYIEYRQEESPKSWVNYEKIVKKWREDDKY